jgi:hypothetical protein
MLGSTAAHAQGGLPTSGTITPSDSAPHWGEKVYFDLTVNTPVRARQFYVVDTYCYDDAGNFLFYALDYGGSRLAITFGGPDGGAFYEDNEWLTDSPGDCDVYLLLDYHNGTKQEAFTPALAEIELPVSA